MNDEAKEILIGIVDYQKIAGTKKELGSFTLENLAIRAQKALDTYTNSQYTTSASIDPFQVEFEQYEFDFKDEIEW